MARLEIDLHDNDSVIWTWPLTLSVAAVGAVLLGVSPVVPWTGQVAVLGVIVVVVAFAGRMASALELRYGHAPLARPGVPAGTARRRVMTRSSGVPLVVVGLGGLLLAVSGGDPVIIGLGLAFVTFGLAVGPAARFVVTPHHLHIDTALWRISVPRPLIGEFEDGDLDVRLRLRDGDFVDIRVDSPIMEYTSGGHWMNARCRVRTVARIVRMLDSVPAAGPPVEAVVRNRAVLPDEAALPDKSVRHRRRPVVIGAILLGAATAIGLAAYGVATWG